MVVEAQCGALEREVWYQNVWVCESVGLLLRCCATRSDWLDRRCRCQNVWLWGGELESCDSFMYVVAALDERHREARS